jgi:hypothetical protein
MDPYTQRVYNVQKKPSVRVPIVPPNFIKKFPVVIVDNVQQTTDIAKIDGTVEMTDFPPPREIPRPPIWWKRDPVYGAFRCTAGHSERYSEKDPYGICRKYVHPIDDSPDKCGLPWKTRVVKKFDRLFKPKRWGNMRLIDVPLDMEEYENDTERIMFKTF